MAVGQLYDRRVLLTIAVPVATPGDYRNITTDVFEIAGGSTGPGMRVKFAIHKRDQKEPNNSEVIVTNLAEATRKRMQQKGTKVTLDAGYAQTGLSRIFRGDARTTDFVRNNADWDATIKLGSGERAAQHARASKSFARGVKAADVLRYLVGQSGLAPGNVEAAIAGDSAAKIPPITTVFAGGYVVHGPVHRSIERLVKSLQLAWSHQDEMIQILAPGQVLAGTTPVISPATGLIGSPEMGTPEKKTKVSLLKFKSLLYWTAPGRQVQLRSDRYDGFVRVKKCDFEGDTHGQEWYTTVEGEVINAK